VASDIHLASEIYLVVNAEEDDDPSHQPPARMIFCHQISPLAKSLEEETIELEFVVDLRFSRRRRRTSPLI
jgi:hypothetical protein